MKGIFVSTGLQLAARGLAALAHCVNGRSLPISGTRSFPVCFMQASSVHCFAGFIPGALSAIRKLQSASCEAMAVGKERAVVGRSSWPPHVSARIRLTAETIAA